MVFFFVGDIDITYLLIMGLEILVLLILVDIPLLPKEPSFTAFTSKLPYSQYSIRPYQYY